MKASQVKVDRPPLYHGGRRGSRGACRLVQPVSPVALPDGVASQPHSPSPAHVGSVWVQSSIHVPARVSRTSPEFFLKEQATLTPKAAKSLLAAFVRPLDPGSGSSRGHVTFGRTLSRPTHVECLFQDHPFGCWLNDSRQ